MSYTFPPLPLSSSCPPRNLSLKLELARLGLDLCRPSSTRRRHQPPSPPLLPLSLPKSHEFTGYNTMALSLMAQRERWEAPLLGTTTTTAWEAKRKWHNSDCH